MKGRASRGAQGKTGNSHHGGVATSQSTDNLQPLQHEHHHHQQREDGNRERPVSQGSDTGGDTGGVKKRQHQARVDRRQIHHVVEAATGNKLGKAKQVLGDISSDAPASTMPTMPLSRASTRGECRLDTNFPLKFVFDLDAIVVPQKLLYRDYIAQSPATVVDLRGWIVNKGLFRQIEHNCKPVLQELLLDDAIGVTPQMLELIRGSPRLRRLSLRNTGMELTFQAAQILGSLSRLVDLDISGCTVDITSFSIVCNTCQALKTLTCQACPGLDDFCLQALASCMQRFRRLQAIDLSRGIDYSDEGYLTVLGATPKLLTRLNMSNTKILTSLSITALRQKMPALTYLDMSEMKLSQTCFEWITEGCNHLKTLILTRCENLDDLAIVRFGSKLLHLEKIVLNHCPKLTDKGVVGFFKGLTESLDLQLGAGLRYIDLSSNIHLGGPPIAALAEYEFKAQTLNGKGIEHLKLNGLSMVTAEALMYMWMACTSIKYFSMAVEMSSTVTHRKSMMPHISDQILIDAQYNSLVDVSLSGCSLITDNGVCSLIEKCCKQLKSVDLSYINGITDMTLYHLAQYTGETLHHLNIGGCNKVTNHGIIALCTDHSDKRRKRRLISSVMDTDAGTSTTTTAEKYQAYSSKSGIFDNSNNDGDGDDESEYTEATPVSHSSHRKVNPSLDALNPFYHSTGCLSLVKLELNGCSKVTDPGVVAMCNLKGLQTLSIRSLDNCTDSPLLLLAETCTKLTSLDISSLDMVSINVVKSFAKNCYQLETLNCDLCNFTSGDYDKVIRPILPLGMPNGLRCKLDPRPRPILEYNRIVVETRDKKFAALVLTKFGIYCIAWGRQRLTKAARIKAIAKIKSVYNEYSDRHRLYKLWGTKNERIRCANILQKWGRSCLGNQVQRWKKRQVWKRSKAALIIERVFRGHKARKRTRNKFRRLFYFYNQIGFLAHKYWVLVHARAFHKKLVKVQSIGRMFPPKLTFILTKRSIITFQIKIRNFLKRRRAVRHVMKHLIRSLEGESVAANVIRKNWRVKMFNKQMSTFVFICAIYWRSIDDEKDWRIVQLQAWWRGQIVRNRNWWVLEVPRVRERKATKIQAAWHMYLARCYFIKLKEKLKRHMLTWRKWTQSCCRLRLGYVTRSIQNIYKLRYFNLMRLYSAINITRYYRGYVARKQLADYEYQIASKFACRITRPFKLWCGRQRRKEIIAVRHMAAWRIQREIHTLFDGEAKRRIQSKQAIRRRKEILDEKAKLMYVIRTHCLEKRKAEFMFIFARRIQKRFRKWSNIRTKRAEALANRDRVKEEAVAEIHKIKSGKLIERILGPLAGIGSAISSTVADMIENKSEHITKADEPRLTNAILKYHTRSIVQLGITNLHITVGDGEYKAFGLGQDMLRTSNKPFHSCIEVDLSGMLRLNVKIWTMNGKGADCLTEIVFHRKPGGTSLAQLRARAVNAAASYKKIIWHSHLDFEIRAGQTIKAGKGGFAITDLKVVLDEDEGEELGLKGYTKIAKLEEFGFPAMIYALSRTPENQDDIFQLGMLAKTPWVDSRMVKVIYTYNLANNDVYALRKVFETICGSALSETVRITEVFSYFGFEYNQIAKWMVEAIKPKRKGELLFSEYAHLVVSQAMFGTKDMMRFLFGCIDTKDMAYLRREQFVELVGYMASGNQNPNVWIMQYDTYKDKKLKNLFFGGFEQFCCDYRAVMWGPESLQTAMRIMNLGEGLWRDKMAHFAEQRKTLGVHLV